MDGFIATLALNLLGVEIESSWKGKDVSEVTQEIRKEILKEYASLAVLRQFLMMANFRDTAEANQQNEIPEGYYRRALAQLNVNKALSEDEKALYDFGYQLAYKQSYSPTYVIERAPNIAEAAETIVKHKKKQLLSSEDYEEKITQASRFALSVGKFTIALQYAIKYGLDIDIILFTSRFEGLAAMMSGVGLDVSNDDKEAFRYIQRQLANDLRRLYNAYINGIPAQASEARARILYDVAIDMEKKLYRQVSYIPLFLSIPELSDQLYGVILKQYPDTGAAEDVREILEKKNGELFSTSTKIVLAGGVIAVSAWWMGVGAFAAAAAVETADLIVGAGDAVHDHAGWTGTILWEVFKGIASGGLDQVRRYGMKGMFTKEGSIKILESGGYILTKDGWTRAIIKDGVEVATLREAPRVVRRLEQMTQPVAQKARAIFRDVIDETRLSMVDASKLRHLIHNVFVQIHGLRVPMERTKNALIRKRAAQIFERTRPNIVLRRGNIKEIAEKGGEILSLRLRQAQGSRYGGMGYKQRKQEDVVFSSYAFPYERFTKRLVGKERGPMDTLVIFKKEVRTKPLSNTTPIDSGFYGFKEVYENGTFVKKNIGDVDSDGIPLWKKNVFENDEMAKEYTERLIEDMIQKTGGVDSQRYRKWSRQYLPDDFPQDPTPELRILHKVTLDDMEAILVPDEMYTALMASEKVSPQFKSKLINYEKTLGTSEGEIGEAYYRYTGITPLKKAGQEAAEGVSNQFAKLPMRIVEGLEEDPFIKRELASSAGVSEGYTIKEHVLMAGKQFERYFSDWGQPLGISKNAFRRFLALHDIGKARALREGNRQLQYKYNQQYVEEILMSRGEDPAFVRTAQALVSADPIGGFLQGAIKIDRAAMQIIGMSKQAGQLQPYDFFELLKVFHQVDAGAYTQDATIEGVVQGVRSSLDNLFVFNHAQRKMRYAPSVDQQVNLLRARVKTLWESEDTLIIDIN